MSAYEAQATTPHFAISRMPVEIVTQILKCQDVTTGDLAAVAGTCRYLRAIATPVLFNTIVFFAEHEDNFAPLHAVVSSQDKGSLVRFLWIKEPKKAIPSDQAVIYSGILVSALDAFSSITALAIPFATLNRPLFDVIFNIPSLSSLSIHPIEPSCLNLDVAGRAPFATARASPIAVSSVETRKVKSSSSSAEYYAYISDLLDFFEFYEVQVYLVELEPFFYASSRPPPSFLTSAPFSTVVDLSVGCLPDEFVETIAWVTEVMEVQGNLENLSFTVMEYLDGFELGWATWAGWVDGEPRIPSAEFDLAWEDVPVKQSTLGLNRADADDEWLTSRVELVLPDDTVITSQMMTALLRQEPIAFMFTISDEQESTAAALRWSDWTSTANALLSHAYLETLTLRTSVTPTTTIKTTIACSSSCYSLLLEVYPALHAACELIGGPAALWTLAVNLNIERLRLLTIENGHIFEVCLIVKGKSDVVLVSLEGTVEPLTSDEVEPPRKRELSFIDAAPHRPTDAKLLDCECFICGRGVDEDPISAVRRCGVKEVRAALAIGGFDLAAFDQSPHTKPVDLDSFEMFLRSKH